MVGVVLGHELSGMLQRVRGIDRDDLASGEPGRGSGAGIGCQRAYEVEVEHDAPGEPLATAVTTLDAGHDHTGIPWAAISRAMSVTSASGSHSTTPARIASPTAVLARSAAGLRSGPVMTSRHRQGNARERRGEIVGRMMARPATIAQQTSASIRAG